MITLENYREAKAIVLQFQKQTVEKIKFIRRIRRNNPRA